MNYRGIIYDLVRKDNDFSINVLTFGNSITFKYPCKSSSECTEYVVQIPKGVYRFEAFGASGGYSDSCPPSPKRISATQCQGQQYVSKYKGNVKCYTNCSSPGSGGYTSAILSLHQEKTFFIAIGGKGSFGTSLCDDNSDRNECKPPPGFNGGGRPASSSIVNKTGGGGGTDIRAEVNDWFHRILVAGGGGGSDGITDPDGFGASGGGFETEGYWIEGTLDTSKRSTQTDGFSFGQGEAGIVKETGRLDIAGSGGGWFGGYSSQNYNGGGGAGSSFVLTHTAVLPTDEIPVLNDIGEEVNRSSYAFDTNSSFVMYDPVLGEGVWMGDGKFILTILLDKCVCTVYKQSHLFNIYNLAILCTIKH